MGFTVKFSRTQIFLVLLLAIGISNHVLLIPHLLQAAGRDAWICILIGYVLLLIWGTVLYFILNKNRHGTSFYSWVKKRAGRPVAGFVVFIMIMYFALAGISIFYDLIQSVNIYFLPLTPTWMIVVPFLSLCIWAAYRNLKTIVYMSVFLLPIVWILGHFVAIATMREKDYHYIFPILTNGLDPVLSGTVVVLGASVDLLVLILLQKHTKEQFSYGNIVILITLLMGLSLGPTIGSIAAFGPEVAAQMRFPAFEQWRLVVLGEHFSHVDFLAVFQLLSGVTIRIALFSFLLYDTLDFKSIHFKKLILSIYTLVLGVVALLPISDIWVETVIRMYLYPVAFIIGFSLSFLLLLISYLPQRKGLGNRL